MNKIIENLEKVKKDIDIIIQELNSSDMSSFNIVFAMFEAIDTLGDTESNLYKYLREKQNGMFVEKKV